MSELRLCGVSKRYDGVDKNALEPLDLTLPSGELAVLVGPSGCGKSTTLRLVAGLEEPSAGQIFIDDRDVTTVPPADRDIAMVFQSYALYPHLSVFDNLGFALRMRKLPAAAIRERVSEVAASLGIEGYLDRKPKNLSGGQRQRVAIGRAVVRSPKLFLFDEPLSNLDAKLRGEMRREIARIHHMSEGTSSLYVTHDQIEAMTLADRIVVMHEGVVQQVGSPMEIYERPQSRFVAGFFGTPAMNFLPAVVDGERARGAGFELGLAGATAASGEIVVGVRPECIGLGEPGAGAASLSAKVALREVLGPEVLLHLESEAGEIVARADAHDPAREGDRLDVWLDPARLHIFDAASERRL